MDVMFECEHSAREIYLHTSAPLSGYRFFSGPDGATRISRADGAAYSRSLGAQLEMPAKRPGA
jgi:hypothetical protein